MAFMHNGDASILIVNDQQAAIILQDLCRFAVKREWRFYAHHFIDKGIHEYAPHAVLVFVA